MTHKKLLLILSINLLILLLPINPTQATPNDFFAPTGYQATWISQTQAGTDDSYFNVKPCDVVLFEAKFLNSGTKTWKQDGNEQVAFNIYKDPKIKSYPLWFNYKLGTAESYFQHNSWLTPFRISNIKEQTVNPGETGSISTYFQIPCDAVGTYREDISLAVGNKWMKSPKETADPLGVAHLWIGFHIQGDDVVKECTGKYTNTKFSFRANCPTGWKVTEAAKTFEYANNYIALTSPLQNKNDKDSTGIIGIYIDESVDVTVDYMEEQYRKMFLEEYMKSKIDSVRFEKSTFKLEKAVIISYTTAEGNREIATTPAYYIDNVYQIMFIKNHNLYRIHYVSKQQYYESLFNEALKIINSIDFT
ncbi:MAG: hypothetical protein WCP97_07980 [bacterium]